MRRSPPARALSISRLLKDRDERFRPRTSLAESVLNDLGTLDRPIVPLLNALYDIGVPTAGSCAGHKGERNSGMGAHVVFDDAGTRVEAATRLLASLFPGHRRTDVRFKADVVPPYPVGAVTFVELASQNELDRDLRVHARYLKVANAIRSRADEIPRRERTTTAEHLVARIYADLAERDVRDRPGTLWEDESGTADLDLWLHHHDPAAPCDEVEGAHDELAAEARWCFVAYEQPSGQPYWRWVLRARSLTRLGRLLRAAIAARKPDL